MELPMIRAISMWVIKSIAAAIVGRAFLSVFHELDIYPDQVLADITAKIFRDGLLSVQIVEKAGWISAGIGVLIFWIIATIITVVRRQRLPIEETQQFRADI